MSKSGKDGVEILRPAGPRSFTCALLDFDGTFSLIRQGWQDVMIPMMVSILRELDHGLSEPALEELVREDVTVLTGRQTIYQMIRLAERVRQFGGAPADPAEYKRRYNRLLMARIEHRRRALADGAAGYVAKDTTTGELITAIVSVLAGRKYVSTSVARRLASRSQASSQPPLHPELSGRE